MEFTLLSKLVSPGARPQVEQQLRRALKKSHEDIKYIPHINEQYPSTLRRHAASLFCTAGFLPREEHPTQDVSIDIPDGILDDVPLAVLLGGVAWFATCLDSPDEGDNDDKHDDNWHSIFCYILYHPLGAFIDFPPPKLSAQISNFYIGLYFDLPDFWDFDTCEERKRFLKIFSAVAIFLRNKNVLFQCCRRCQVLFTRFFWDATFFASINESSVITDSSGILSQSISATLY